MKTTPGSSKPFFLQCIAGLLLSASAASTPPGGQVCTLNFTSAPYKPSGECINGVSEEVNNWDVIPNEGCCQNALQALVQALALQANTGDGNLFIRADHWRNCDGIFDCQQSVSFQKCGFDDLFYGSSLCSRLKLSTFNDDPNYLRVFKSCSSFTPSFDSSCKSCTGAILQARDHLQDQLEAVRNQRERAICGVAVIIAIAATEFSNQSVAQDFYSCLPALSTSGSKDYIKVKTSLAKALLAIFLSITVLMLIIILIKYVTNKTEKKQKKMLMQIKSVSAWSAIYRFSKAEVENAINYGIERSFLGQGSAGRVFKGVLPSGQIVAIKQIFKSNTSDSFSREIEGLSRVRHPNLVCLLGGCVEDGDQYLVYEYCSAGNLAQHLLHKGTVLLWEKRVKILRDCALALRYLHHYVDGCIVHRDIKLTNILLTEDLEPKLSDFGLAKILGLEESKVFTDVRGTIGYMDPEYMSNAKLTCASDIYSFGIVALQVLSGQKVIELDLDARDQLTRKARDVSFGKRPLMDFVDPRLQGDLNMTDFESILQLAVLCVARSSDGRPSIDIVFEELDKAWNNTLADLKGWSVSATRSRSIEFAGV